jgi:hypothetical protein
VSSNPRSIGRNGRGVTGARKLRDRFCRGIGLLRRDPAVLEWEGGDVACGVDVVAPFHPSIWIGAQKAATIGGQARNATAVGHGQRDHAAGADRPPGHDDKRAVPVGDRRRVRVKTDAARLQQAPDRVGRLAAEQRERLRLGRDDVHAYLRRARVLQPDLRHQRELAIPAASAPARLGPSVFIRIIAASFPRSCRPSRPPQSAP